MLFLILILLSYLLFLWIFFDSLVDMFCYFSICLSMFLALSILTGSYFFTNPPTHTCKGRGHDLLYTNRLIESKLCPSPWGQRL